MRTLLLFWMVACSAGGATYFVDYESGNNANAGTTSAAPWKHSPGDDRATASAAITLASGDTVTFKGGVNYVMGATNTLQLNSSGVTLLSGHMAGTPWGTDYAVVDCTLAAPTNAAIDGIWYLAARSNVTVKGFYFTGGTYQDSYSSQLGWRGGSGTDGYIYVTDCVFSNHVESAIYIVGDFDSGDFSRHFTITNCTFKEIGTHAIFMRYGLTNVQVLNCSFNRIGTRTNSPGPGGDPIAVFGNDGPSWNAGLIVRGCNMSDSPIKSHIILSDQHSGALIENNYFHGTNGYSGLDLNANGTNLTIRNNLFDMTVANFYSPIVVDTDQGTGILLDGLKIYNNTIKAATANIGLVFLGKGNSGSDQTSKNVDIRNNVFISTTASRSMIYIETSATGKPATEMSTFTCDYNTFQTNGYATAFHLQSTNYSFSGWKALGYDANSSGGTPNFSSEFILDASDTIALNRGVDLITVATDRIGTARPQQIVWDIGAHELPAPNPARLGPGKFIGGGRR